MTISNKARWADLNLRSNQQLQCKVDNLCSDLLDADKSDQEEKAEKLKSEILIHVLVLWHRRGRPRTSSQDNGYSTL